VTLIDVADGLAQGKALDLMHMRSIEQFGPTILGTGDYADTAGSDIVVVTAGIPRKPGMTREDLLSINAGIARSVLENALPVSPDALYVFVTNPLDVITNYAFSIAGLPKQRLFGMGGVLDTARFTYSIAKQTGADPSVIDALVIGAHGEAMVPLPRLSTVNGVPLPELLTSEQIETIVDDTIQGGAAVVKLLQTGSAFYAPASSIALMVAEILKPGGRILSTCARLEGEYGIDGVYMCVPAILGAGGVEKIVELELTDDELAKLRGSADSIKEQIPAFE
jgi:malate dehydrogenase